MNSKNLNTKQIWFRRVVFFSIAAGLACYSYYYAREESKKLYQIKLDQAEALQVIAERKVADSSLIAQAREELLQGFDFGYAVLDEEGRVVGDINRDIGWNAALERWTGKSAEEMLGNTLESIMIPETWNFHQSAYVAAIVDLKEKGKDSKFYGRNIRHACKIIRPNGSELSLTVSARFNQLQNGQWVGQALLDRSSRIINLEDGSIDWSDPFTILEKWSQALNEIPKPESEE